MLTDALDGTLSAEDQATFDLHILACTACSQMLSDARRGAAWLEMLKSPRPEPSAALLDRIFAQTSGQKLQEPSATPSRPASTILLVSNPTTLLARPQSAPADRPQLASSAPNVLPFPTRLAAVFSLRVIGHTLLQPRLAMTAAMAFFSVALTLNLTGVQLTQLRPSDLKPSSLKHDFYEANAHVVRYYDNLRVVYELESRVRDLQRSDDTPKATPTRTAPDRTGAEATPKSGENPKDTSTPGQQPKSKPNVDNNKQSRPRPSPGTSRREDPGGNMQYVIADARMRTFEAFLPGINNYNIVRYIQEGRRV